MELREGYKKTEAGIIPNEWTPKTYGELFQFLTTSSFSRDELSEEGDVRCVHYGDVHTKYHQFLDFSNGFNSFIDLERGKKYPFVKDGDIIMADASEDYSGIGKSVEVKNLGDKLAISGLHTFLLRDKDGDFEDGFKAYIHSIAPVKKSMDRLATGLKVYGVSKANLKTVLVPVPPPSEQRAIATALSDIDTLITNLDKLIAKKKAIKMGAMQRLLKSPAQGGQRLPDFEGEWVEISLGECCDNISSGSSDTSSTSGIYPIYGSTGTIGIKNTFDYSGEKILVARVGANAGTIYRVKGEYCVSDNTLMLTCKANLNLDFAFYFLVLFNLNKLIFGSGQPLITGGQLKAIKIFLPRIEEQKAIASILSDMDKEIESLETKNLKYLRIKQGMMQELLTGKTRLV